MEGENCGCRSAFVLVGPMHPVGGRLATPFPFRSHHASVVHPNTDTSWQHTYLWCPLTTLIAASPNHAAEEAGYRVQHR